MLDPNRLRVFLAIAKEGSVTAAADALDYAQPSVSHHLARLEADVGQPLVQRGGRGVRLTEAGRLLARRAEELLGQLESVGDELAAYAGLQAGRVRLAAFPSALATLVPTAAARLAVRHPDLDLALTEAEPPEALAALRAGEVDAAMIFEHGDPRPSDTRNLELEPLLDEPLYVVGPAGTPRAARSAGLAGYAEQRWIAGCPSCRTHLLSSCAAAGFTPRIAFETDDYVAVQALVAAQMAVATLPGLALMAHRNPGVAVERLADTRRVLTATYGRPPLPHPVRAFLDALGDGLADPTWP